VNRCIFRRFLRPDGEMAYRRTVFFPLQRAPEDPAAEPWMTVANLDQPLRTVKGTEVPCRNTLAEGAMRPWMHERRDLLGIARLRIPTLPASLAFAQFIG
jgi:hypothetical protein